MMVVVKARSLWKKRKLCQAREESHCSRVLTKRAGITIQRRNTKTMQSTVVPSAARWKSSTGPNIDSRYGLWVPSVMRLTLSRRVISCSWSAWMLIALRHIHDVGAPGLLCYCASMCAQTRHDPARAVCQARTWPPWSPWSPGLACSAAGGPKGAPTTCASGPVTARGEGSSGTFLVEARSRGLGMLMDSTSRARGGRIALAACI